MAAGEVSSGMRDVFPKVDGTSDMAFTDSHQVDLHVVHLTLLATRLHIVIRTGGSRVHIVTIAGSTLPAEAGTTLPRTTKAPPPIIADQLGIACHAVDDAQVLIRSVVAVMSIRDRQVLSPATSASVDDWRRILHEPIPNSSTRVPRRTLSGALRTTAAKTKERSNTAEGHAGSTAVAFLASHVVPCRLLQLGANTTRGGYRGRSMQHVFFTLNVTPATIKNTTDAI